MGLGAVQGGGGGPGACCMLTPRPPNYARMARGLLVWASHPVMVTSVREGVQPERRCGHSRSSTVATVTAIARPIEGTRTGDGIEERALDK